MIKLIVLFGMALFLFGCGSGEVNSAKESAVDSISKKAQAGSIHLLECQTGEPVYADVKEKLSELFKIQTEKSVQVGVYVSSGTTNKGLGDSLCTGGVSLVLPYLIKLGENKIMPESWVSDGCSFKNVGEDFKEVAFKLCSKI